MILDDNFIRQVTMIRESMFRSIRMVENEATSYVDTIHKEMYRRVYNDDYSKKAKPILDELMKLQREAQREQEKRAKMKKLESSSSKKSLKHNDSDSSSESSPKPAKRTSKSKDKNISGSEQTEPEKPKTPTLTPEEIQRINKLKKFINFSDQNDDEYTMIRFPKTYKPSDFYDLAMEFLNDNSFEEYHSSIH